MELSSVVPWGRKLSEYRAMFSLRESELAKKILGCGDGPASFNRELTERGGQVVSVDPVYQFDAMQIRARIDAVYPDIMSQMEKNRDHYLWSTIPDVTILGRVRMEAMNDFLSDFQSGKQAGRYIDAALPILPFEDNTFELALCSHYLFLYSEHVNQAEHLLSIKELCRVAQEVRIYPLVALDGSQSKHLEPVISLLENSGFLVSLDTVDYQFQKGATEMMVVQLKK